LKLKDPTSIEASQARFHRTTYPDLVEHFNGEKFLDSRAILASNIDIVNQISDYILSLVPGDHKDRVS